MKTVSVKGLDDIIKRLDEMVSDEIIDSGVAKTAALIQGQAKLLAPVDTGDLRRSIKLNIADGHTAEVYTNSDHAIFNEYGTGTKGDKEVAHTTKESWVYKGTDGKYHTSHGMMPRPFMRPAAEEGARQAAEIFSRIIKEGEDR